MWKVSSTTRPTGKHKMTRTALQIVGLILCLLELMPCPASAGPSIPAKAWVVVDDSGTIINSSHPNARLAPASTVKLVTAMVVLDSVCPDMPVMISKHAGKVHSIRPRLLAGEEMTVKDLLRLALMQSVNSAAVALAEATADSEPDFVVMMNDKAREIGAENTLFANASGLPNGRQYTTASDLVLILKTALTYPLIREILSEKIAVITTADGRDLLIENTNNLLWQDENMIGGKTGYTGTARHCFVCAVNTDNGPLFTAVLGARTRRSLWTSTEKLSAIGRDRLMMKIKYGDTGFAPEKPVNNHAGDLPPIIKDSGNPCMITTMTQ
jgi:D-alanyl-D-alanine carboxypeptidase (penicillin-binding protein 5/6)